MPTYFDDYIETFKELGEPDFNRSYRYPVLIGLGVVGTLAEGGERGHAQTFLATLYEESESAQSLMRRVWFIVKGEYGPVTPGIRVGRSADNDVVINDYSISKHHCEFRRDHGVISLMDLDSHNGTLIGGKEIPEEIPIAIEDEDEIVLGRYMFEYLDAQTFLMRIKTAAKANH